MTLQSFNEGIGSMLKKVLLIIFPLPAAGREQTESAVAGRNTRVIFPIDK